MMTFNFKTHWRTTTALCIVSTITLATTAYAANPGGVIQQLISDIESDIKNVENSAGNKGSSSNSPSTVKTASPIKHVIVLIGENRGLDHTFGVYKPKGEGQTISNLLSKGIVNEDGTPGPNFSQSLQFSVAAQSSYYIGAPTAAKFPYTSAHLMPQPNTNGAPEAQSATGAPFLNTTIASAEKDIAPGSLDLLTTGATNLANNITDTRIPGAGGLMSGSFQMQGPMLSEDDYTGDTTHRFYQDWQQSDCSVASITKDNTSGCLKDLFPFVMDTYDRTSATSQGNFSEGNSMGFYNAQNGEVPFLKSLADRFTLGDNFHQSFHGGTGANHVMLGTGDAIFWSDGNGNPIPPTVPNQIANPNPAKGTINMYTADNNFSACFDATQPGVGPIVDYLNNLPYAAEPNCAANTFYMLDNSNPGFLPNGALANSEGGIPPSPVRTIGDSLLAANISWVYYGGSFNAAVALSNDAVKAGSTNFTAFAVSDPANAVGVAYCQICNPFQYATSIMANPAVRTAHIQDTSDLITAIQNNTLPSVSFGKPDGLLDGHPSSSKVDLFEAYVTNILTALDANPALKAETAVFVTWDEAGGYWDSGFVQSIDFFGDGPRIPILILSPYSTGGKVYHNYGDHVSILKFIERNWNLQPITNRSRDNLPNPTFKKDNAYVPTNSPALADLFDAFDFSKAVNISLTE
jgi:phospholipase C